MKPAWPLLLNVLLIGGIIGYTVGCGGEEPSPRDSAPESTISFRDDGDLSFLRGDAEVVTIDIEIAETDSARQRGLMQRTSLPDRSGMFFIFDRQERQSFWMSNTPIALDLLFVNEDSQIVDVDRYARPFSTDPIPSDAPARYVIEVPAGFADTYGLVEGERVTWTRE
ncbi:MAG: DUF192 domain-containing protein [Rhodothermales bacterium]